MNLPETIVRRDFCRGSQSPSDLGGTARLTIHRGGFAGSDLESLETEYRESHGGATRELQLVLVLVLAGFLNFESG